MRSLKPMPALLVAICALVSLVVLGTANGAVPAPSATFNAYLPLVLQAPNTTSQPTVPPTNPPPTTPTPQPPTGADGGMFLDPAHKTASRSILADAQGGLHVAYHYAVPENQGPDVVYAYCPPPGTQCLQESGWSRVRIAGPVEEVQLQLTPGGQPRILAARFAGSAYGRLAVEYRYYECDSNCLDAANWQSGVVTSALQSYVPDTRDLQRRFFALDRQGLPRFVFTDRGTDVNGENRYGGYLYACDADCTVATNWQGTRFTRSDPETNYNHEIVSGAVLQYTSANQPRILAEFYPLSSESEGRTKITYFACDTGCESDANWQRVGVTPRGDGPKPAWDLELDAQDRPRVVVYHEETGDERSDLLFYFFCDTGCLTANAWQPVNLELDENIGESADLELDAQGFPRIAHLASNGVLVYSWCNESCADTSKWLHGVAEKPEALDTAEAVVIPTSCTAGVWENYGVSLALDPEGNPRIAYNATYHAQCPNLPTPGEPPSNSFQEVAQLVRLFFSPEPQ